jgi:hypothetical protein
MEERRSAYTSTVVAPAQIVLGVLAGLVLAAIVLGFGGLWPFAVIGFVIVAATGWYLAVVRLAVKPGDLTIAQGRGDRHPREIHRSEVARAEVATLTWSACFGIGVPAHWRTTRLSVRPGPTLVLTLTDDELVRISTPDPATAIEVLTGVRPEPVTQAPPPAVRTPPPPVIPTPPAVPTQPPRPRPGRRAR